MAPELRYEYLSYHEYNVEPISSSVMILLYTNNNQICFPLIRRPKYNGIHSGQISLPGGKVESQDQNRIETALRETYEEIKVDPKLIQIIGCLTELYIPVSNYMVFPVVGAIHRKPNFIANESEVAEILEAKITFLLEEEYKKETILNVENGISIRAPYFDINNNIVWGATAMILNEFSAILKSAVK